MNSNFDEELSLPSDTLQILNVFLHEKAKREHEEQEKILKKSGKDTDFEEDWQLSQFWYSESTKAILGRIIKKLVSLNNNYQVGLLSCPSLYNTIKSMHANVQIFEYDRRFSAYGDDFVFYDFNEADTPNYLCDHIASYDVIIADPPFLSQECIAKISIIINKLLKSGGKIIFCSGEVVEPWVSQTLGLTKCVFRPEHERNLGNEFASYSNFNLDELM